MGLVQCATGRQHGVDAILILRKKVSENYSIHAFFRDLCGAQVAEARHLTSAEFKLDAS